MGNLRLKRVCAFSVSGIHFSMMILPYINKELENSKDIITLLEVNLENNIKQILSKITLNNESKEKLSNINWKATDIEKTDIEKFLKRKLTKEKKLTFIIYGREKHIKTANEKISKIINKKIKNPTDYEIKIIDCYLVNDFNENIREILDNHDKIFNTSGEHEINEIFEDYKPA